MLSLGDNRRSLLSGKVLALTVRQLFPIDRAHSHAGSSCLALPSTAEYNEFGARGRNPGGKLGPPVENIVLLPGREH